MKFLMMSKTKYFFYLFITILFFSCGVDKSKVNGLYVIVNNENTIDSLILMNRFRYERKIYTSNGRFIYKNSGKWKIENGSRIEFSNFFIDRDLVYSEDYYVNEESLMYVTFEIEKIFSNVKIFSNINLKNSYYLKVKNDNYTSSAKSK